MREIRKSNNFSAKDNFNIIGAETLDSIKGTIINVVGCAYGTDISTETGEVVETGYLKDSNGKIYSTISPTALQSISVLAEMEIGSGVEIAVESRKSKAGREFIVLLMA